MVDGMDQQTAQGANGKVSSNSTARVDRDFGVYHKNDVNQFSDDRAKGGYKSTSRNI